MSPSVASPLLPGSVEERPAAASRPLRVALVLGAACAVAVVSVSRNAASGRQTASSLVVYTDDELWQNVTTPYKNLLEPTCAYFDDDGRFPGTNELHSCMTKDTKQCNRCLPSSDHTGSSNCYDTCGSTCDYAVRPRIALQFVSCVPRLTGLLVVVVCDCCNEQK